MVSRSLNELSGMWPSLNFQPCGVSGSAAPIEPQSEAMAGRFLSRNHCRWAQRTNVKSTERADKLGRRLPEHSTLIVGIDTEPECAVPEAAATMRHRQLDATLL
jgi:hypothetical protein